MVQAVDIVLCHVCWQGRKGFVEVIGNVLSGFLFERIRQRRVEELVAFGALIYPGSIEVVREIVDAITDICPRTRSKQNKNVNKKSLL